MRLRTDLAVEAREIAGENIGGVDFDTYSENGMEISRLTVRTERARLALGKEEGTYVTIELESLTDRFSDTDGRLRTIGAEIRRLLPVNGLLLVAGLGNEEITPDSLGPKTAAKVLATRHITGELARATGLDRLRPVAVMSTGVTGQTGIETPQHRKAYPTERGHRRGRARFTKARAARLYTSDQRRGNIPGSGSRQPPHRNQQGNPRCARDFDRRSDRS